MTRAGDFDAYAVTTRHGPHVTMQAGVVQNGRYWTTATRHSVKSRSVGRNRHASATVNEDGLWRVVAGEASVLDGLHPTSLAREPVASALAGGAVLRLGLDRLDQLLGYAEVGTAVPLSFLPTGRVLLVTDIEDELVLDGDDAVSASGRWASGQPARLLPTGAPEPHDRPDAALADVPDEIVALAAEPGPAWLGVATHGGPIALPAEWEPATGRLQLGRSALEMVGAELPGSVCVTVDNSGSRRPDEKLGVMLRGAGTLVDMDGTAASVAIAVQRVTYWCGFASATPNEAA